MAVNGVWQLERLTVNYCNWGGSSAGVRSFLAGGLVGFAEANPNLKIVARAVKGNKHPHAVAVYRNGTRQQMSLRNLEGREIDAVLRRLRDRTGRKMASLKRWHSPKLAVPSVQGEWRPDYFADERGPKVPFTAVAANAGAEAARK